MWQDIKLLLLLLIVPKNLMDYVMSAVYHCILPESPIYSVDIIVLFFCFTALFLNQCDLELLCFCFVLFFFLLIMQQESRGSVWEKRIEVITYYYGIKLVAAGQEGRGGGGLKGRRFGAGYACHHSLLKTRPNSVLNKLHLSHNSVKDAKRLIFSKGYPD